MWKLTPRWRAAIARLLFALQFWIRPSPFHNREASLRLPVLMPLLTQSRLTSQPNAIRFQSSSHVKRGACSNQITNACSVSQTISRREARCSWAPSMPVLRLRTRCLERRMPALIHSRHVTEPRTAPPSRCCYQPSCVGMRKPALTTNHYSVGPALRDKITTQPREKSWPDDWKNCRKLEACVPTCAAPESPKANCPSWPPTLPSNGPAHSI